MTYDDIDRPIRLFLGARELLRRLGFKADEVFFVTARSPEDRALHVFCELLTQGKSFAVDCGPAEKSEAAIVAAYDRASAAVNDGSLSEAELERVWADVRMSAAPLTATLVGKGVELPCKNWGMS